MVSTTLDDRERNETLGQLLRVVSEDVGTIPMSYNMEVIPVRKGLVGPGMIPSVQTSSLWNVHDWAWTQ